MLKNLKRASAIMLSLAMAVQFGLADTYYANTLSEEPIIEETQEQEPVTVEEGSQQVAVEQTEAPAIDAKEEFVQVPETKSVTLSYVAEDGTILKMAALRDFDLNHNLNTDTVYPLRHGNASTFPPKKTIARICSLTKSLYCDIT